MADTHLPLTLIAAVARNGVIGGDNRLLWHLRADLQRFKALTMGKPLLMGRKTWDSIGRPLPGRETIVLTRDKDFGGRGVYGVQTLQAGLALCTAIGLQMGAAEIMVAGGGEIYALSLGMAKKLHITEVDLEPAGDVHFPAIDKKIWSETSRTAHPKSPQDDAAYAFVDYVRASSRG